MRGEPPVQRIPRVLRCWVDDSTAGDIGAEHSAVTCIRGLRSMELLSASDLLQVNRIKSAVAATPESHRRDMATLIQGRHEWSQGGVLIVDEGEVDDDVVEVIKARLEVGDGLVQVAGHEALEWPVAGKAAVLVHLPGAGVPPTTARLLEVGGGVVLRGWPDVWDRVDLERGVKALRGQRRRPRLAVPVVAALKDLGVVIGGGVQGRAAHQHRLGELFRRTGLVARIGIPFVKRERLIAGSALPAGLYGCASQPLDADTIDVARRHVLHALHKGVAFLPGWALLRGCNRLMEGGSSGGVAV